MSRRRNEYDELIRQKTLLGSKLPKIDPDYQLYVGADWLDASTMAGIQFILKSNLVKNPRIRKKLTLIMEYYNQKRKAYFVTWGSDVLTKLAIIIGESKNVRDANARPNLPRIGDNSPIQE